MPDMSHLEVNRRWPAQHPDRIQLYSLPTPNGVKASIMLEETGLPYEAHLVSFGEDAQKSPEFLSINPNGKIPAIVDPDGPGGKPIAIFESGAILLYLAEKFGAFLGTSRAETLSWLFWQMGSAPLLGGGFGHFFAYAPVKIEYAIDRYTMEVKRQLSVLDQRLAQSEFVAGGEYSIADIAIWPWYGSVVRGRIYEGADVFVGAEEYTNVKRWADQIWERRAVKRGWSVNRTYGPDNEQLSERHSAADLDALGL